MAVIPSLLNLFDAGAPVALSNSGRSAQWGATCCVRSVDSVTEGKWYFEVTLNSGALPLVGVVTKAAQLTAYPGSDAYGWTYYFQSGNRYHNSSFAAYASGTSAGGTVGVKLDMDAGTLSFVVGGTDRGVAFSGLPAELYLAVGGGGTNADKVTVNFGQSSFVNTVPSGYNAGFGTVAATFSGVVHDAADNPAVRTVRAFRRDNGALVATATSDASGAYTFTGPLNVELQVVCLDDVAGTVEEDKIMRALAS